MGALQQELEEVCSRRVYEQGLDAIECVMDTTVRVRTSANPYGIHPVSKNTAGSSVAVSGDTGMRMRTQGKTAAIMESGSVTINDKTKAKTLLRRFKKKECDIRWVIKKGADFEDVYGKAPDGKASACCDECWMELLRTKVPVLFE